MRNRSLPIILSALAGIVIGTLIAQMTAGVPGLSWLAYSMSFGTSAPLAVDLRVISFTLGAQVNISIAVIICVAIAILLGRLIVRK